MQQQEIIPNLFRTEFRKITAVLCKHFGIEHIGTAEDIASDTFLLAIETWTYKGLPVNPTAWLYTVAKNKEGKQEAIAEAEKLNSKDNHFYFTLLGELYTDIDNKTAKESFQKAFSFAKTQTDKQTIQKRINELDSLLAK